MSDQDGATTYDDSFGSTDEVFCWRCGPLVVATHRATDRAGQTRDSCYGHLQFGWRDIRRIEGGA